MVASSGSASLWKSPMPMNGESSSLLTDTSRIMATTMRLPFQSSTSTGRAVRRTLRRHNIAPSVFCPFGEFSIEVFSPHSSKACLKTRPGLLKVQTETYVNNRCHGRRNVANLRQPVDHCCSMGPDRKNGCESRNTRQNFGAASGFSGVLSQAMSG